MFPKGLTHGFWSKTGHFSMFFFQAIQAKKMSFTILQNDKPAFQAIKTKISNSRKIDILPEGLTHGFNPRMEIFPTFFFSGNIGQENVFYDILEQKNSILGYKNERSTQSKNCHFSKGVSPRFWSKNGYFCKFFFLGNIGQENVFYDILKRKNVFLAYRNNKFKKSNN